MSNQRFHNALARTVQPTPPIWMMRQAGRYHQHYQQFRRQHSFWDLCTKPALAAQIALGPVEDFGFDVAILFSDLLFPLAALGFGLAYTDAGPQLSWRLDETTFGQMREVEEAWPELAFQGEALRLTRTVLPEDRSLIGFVGGPWTLFTYAVEGRHSGTLAPSKKLLRLFPQFCERLIPLLARNINDQYENGAEVVMIFDTAAGELPADVYRAEVVPQLARVAAACARPPGYYSKGTQPAHLRDDFFTGGALAGIGVDYRWEMREALDMFPCGFVQGNFDPAFLFMDGAELAQRLRAYLHPLADAAARAGWVCGLGHGVLPGTPAANVRLFVETVREVLQ